VSYPRHDREIGVPGVCVVTHVCGEATCPPVRKARIHGDVAERVARQRMPATRRASCDPTKPMVTRAVAVPQQASGEEDGDALATLEGHGPETTTTGEPR
jgi:hypothetical protein